MYDWSESFVWKSNLKCEHKTVKGWWFKILKEKKKLWIRNCDPTPHHHHHINPQIFVTKHQNTSLHQIIPTLLNNTVRTTSFLMALAPWQTSHQIQILSQA